jgi:hypothetical protein
MDKEMQDFCSKVIKLKAQGFFVQDVGSEYGPQFDGMYRWMSTKSGGFQDGEMSFSEVEAWADCINVNLH